MDGGSPAFIFPPGVRAPFQAEPMKDGGIQVSVVIPTFGREDLLCRCVKDVLNQQHPAFETIIVDQTPRHLPETEVFLKSVADRVKVLRMERPSVTAACNEGARVASGEVLVFLDDDVQITDAHFLRRHKVCYENPAVGVVAGRVRDMHQASVSRYDPRSADPVWGWYFTNWDHDVRAEVVTAPGANMSCRKDLFQRLGGFDEMFVGNAVRFENDFCLRVRRAGYQILFEPTACVFHQYNSPGGHDNRHLFGKTQASHRWYVMYFRNMVYATVKHMPVGTWPAVLWNLWREHAFNRPFARIGVRFLSNRHRALISGIWQGVSAGWGRRLR